MIRVTVELCSAITGRSSVIGRATIHNTGTGDYDLGTYDAEVTETPWPIGPGQLAKCRQTTVQHNRRLSVWNLIETVLQKVTGEGGA